MHVPATIFVQPIVNKIYETTLSLIQEEVLALFGVKKDVEKLLSTLKTIQVVLEDAEERQVNDGPVGLWLSKLKMAAYDADDILDTFATETFLLQRKQQVSRIRAPIFASMMSINLNVAHKIKKISEKLDAIAKEKNDYNLTARLGAERSQNIQRRGFHVNDEDVFGRDSDRDALIGRILSNESGREGDVSVIPIVGMGGLGKTTLAQYIFNDERVKNHFEFSIWVSVTVEFNLKMILKEMIEFHTKMKYSNDVSQSILESRFLEFLAGKNFLLVLDDVWSEVYEEWKGLWELLKKGGQGSRILVTTRSTRVADIVGTQPAFELNVLPEEECWSLFKKIAFNDCNSMGGKRIELEAIGREIVGKCNQLPLAVKAMGGLLYGIDDIGKWKHILGHSVWQLEGKKQKSKRPGILPALKLSYDHLPSYLKQCFAYSSVFPKAYVFDRKELVKLWMAEGFIQPCGEDSAEETGIEYFDELLMRSFFQIVNIDDKVRYRMHDLIHDLAASVSSPMCCQCQVKDSKSFIFSKESRHISLLGQDVETPTLQIIEKSKKLRTFLLPDESLKSLGNMIDEMFHSLKYIRVLDLSSSLLSELPSSIEKLKLLRFLDLSKTEIKVLPNSICNLCNLQTLKLLGCLWLFELPQGFGNLVNLRYLELDEMFWFKCRMVPPRMGNLTSLQNLHAFPVSGTSGDGIKELKDMAHLTGALHISNPKS